MMMFSIGEAADVLNAQCYHCERTLAFGRYFLKAELSNGTVRQVGEVVTCRYCGMEDLRMPFLHETEKSAMRGLCIVIWAVMVQRMEYYVLTEVDIREAS